MKNSVSGSWAIIFLITVCNGSSSGVESRLATLTIDKDDLQKLLGISSRLAMRTLDKDDHEKPSRIINRFDVPSTIQPGDVSQLATTLPVYSTVSTFIVPSYLLLMDIQPVHLHVTMQP